MTPHIAIIGAGNVGRALGERFVRAGYSVRLGVRNPEAASDVRDRFAGRAAVEAAAHAAASADVLFLCVPAAQAVSAARALGDLQGKVVVDCTNPVAWSDGPVLQPPPEGSVAAALAAALPGARIVKGFNAFGAEIHADPDLDGASADVYLASDDRVAVEAVSGIATALGFTPVDAGPLRNAALLESLAVLWIHLATKGGHSRQIAFKLVRRE
jgi:NADPH-dependent F420 reductase